MYEQARWVVSPSQEPVLNLPKEETERDLKTKKRVEMKHSLFRIAAGLTILLPLIIMSISGCGKDDRTLFEHSYILKQIRGEGATDIRDITMVQGNDMVTVMETFYNQDDIWVGFELRGRSLIAAQPVFEFSFNGSRLGTGAHGAGINNYDSDPDTQHMILSPSSSFDVKDLPDEFTLRFEVIEQEYPERVFSFDLPLKRSDKEVVLP